MSLPELVRKAQLSHPGNLVLGCPVCRRAFLYKPKGNAERKDLIGKKIECPRCRQDDLIITDDFWCGIQSFLDQTDPRNELLD